MAYLAVANTLALVREAATVLELDDRGEPINERHAERRAATYLYRYCTGELHSGEADLGSWECELY